MMMNFKDHYFKIPFIKEILILVIAISLTSCFGKNEISFCEKIDDNFKTQNCGNKFLTGNLPVLINSKKAFTNDKIVLKIYLLSTGHSEEIRSYSIKVEKNKKTAKFIIPMYQAGIYEIKAYMNKHIISKTQVQIID